jgi:MFS family permease
MAMLDGTVVNVALPTIGKDLHTSLAGLQWTVTAYTLTLAGLPLAVGLTGTAYRDPAAMDSSFRAAMVICACLLAAAAVLSALTIDNGVLRAGGPAHPVAEPECRTCCPVGAPPLEPGNPVEAPSHGH